MSDLTWKSLGLAALIAGGASMAALGGASATTLPATPGGPVQVSHHDGNVVLVGKKKHRRYRSWKEYHRHHGGHRYRYRHGPYVHYYHGYYYASPWWTLAIPVGPGVVVAPAPGVVVTTPGVTIQLGN